MKILLVDDEAKLVDLFAGHLRDAGHEVVTSTSGTDAVRALGSVAFDTVITDLRMEPVGGMEVLKAARAAGAPPDVLIVTAYGTVDTAVAAMKAGAADFITKPVKLEELSIRIAQLGEKRALRQENVALKGELAATGRFAEMVGASAGLQRVRDLVARVAPSDTSVLVLGESGVGKELVARLIHRQSGRAARPFVTVHAAALPETLLESELFGYEKGAFTGAAGRKPGRLEAAAGGTVFLDEIGEITPAFQVKLLRFLQEKTFVRLGGNEVIAVDCRIIAATNRDLQEEMAAGRFREDLYYRLAVFPINVPPLRERRADIGPLVEHALHRLGYTRPLPAEVLQVLQDYDWPGNVRELENVLERGLILARGEELGPRHIQLPEPVLARPEAAGRAGTSLLEVEKQMLEDALAKSGGNKSRAAKLLGITRRMLYTKLAKFGIATDEEP
ncbi:sigma-54-dependent Fis family transcriptional regulator [candidate division WOR-3 bacterium]|nr:sigma-54-dependent Fis family transcriptional regulator [candidate division WOR-3 bacterium]